MVTLCCTTQITTLHHKSSIRQYYSKSLNEEYLEQFKDPREMNNIRKIFWLPNKCYLPFLNVASLSLSLFVTLYLILIYTKWLDSYSIIYIANCSYLKLVIELCEGQYSTVGRA